MMFSHVNIGANDPARLHAFYDAVLAPLGVTRFWATPDGSIVGWRDAPGEPALYVGPPFDGGSASPGNGGMCAFRAASRAIVDAAHAAALAAGGTCDGPPGLRPHYAPDYYGAYMRDPEGNKLHVVHRAAWGVLPVGNEVVVG